MHVNGTTTGWTREREALLRHLWSRGDLSAAQIAKELGGGLSRNAVLGKAHRLGIAVDRPKPQSKVYLSKAQVRQRNQTTSSPFQRGLPIGDGAKFSTTIKEPLIETVPPDDTAIPLHQRKTLVDLEPHECRWPVGDPRESDFFFCGAQRAPGLSYCEHHVRRAHTMPDLMVREAAKAQQHADHAKFEDLETV